MSQETARKSVDFLLRNSGDHHTVTLVFFGGEPLMNFRLISETVPYATKAGQAVGKRVDFSMTTNATYLTPEIIHFLRDHRIGVAVSIDGPKKFHDLRRTYKSGLGSYDMIEPRVMNSSSRAQDPSHCCPGYTDPRCHGSQRDLRASQRNGIR